MGRLRKKATENKEKKIYKSFQLEIWPNDMVEKSLKMSFFRIKFPFHLGKGLPPSTEITNGRG